MKKIIATLLVSSALICGSTACNQGVTAALVGELGTAGRSLAQIENNPSLATQIQNDTNAAVAAINGWKPGTPAQETIQVINILIDDLNLIPGTGPYAALVDLALGTAENIITIIEAQSPTTATSAATAHAVRARQVHLANPPTTKGDFKKQWDALVAANPALAPAKLK